MSEWIPVSERLPDTTRRYLIAARGDVTEAIFHSGDCSWEACNSRQRVTADYWMPLPSPPPFQSSRDRWWNSLATVDTAGELRFIQEPMAVHGTVRKAAAFAIWDAAIAASKRDDFVP